MDNDKRYTQQEIIEEYYQSIHSENKYSQCDLQKTNLEYFMEHTNV